MDSATMSSGPVLTIIGPTAVGKSTLAMSVAEKFNGEIVNADSMQCYQGMDIGTAKPSTTDRSRVPHHVIDVWSPDHEVSVVEFRDTARTAIVDIQGRGRLPIVVGGSWLYVQAIVDDIDFPPTDPAVRKRLEMECMEFGVAKMYERLCASDPQAAADILPGNERRIIRALEVIELTGSFKARLPEAQSWLKTVWCGLDVTRNELDKRIADRVDEMWREGFVDEVKSLSMKGLGKTASRALGYAQILAHLRGECTEAQAHSDTINTTRHFARRQQRRFRSNHRVHWLTQANAIEQVEDLLDHGTRT
jgi:tRNA dimethylallyltransferase